MARRSPTLTRAVTGLAARAVAVFQRVEVRGGPIPEGPVMVVANHQNALIDPMVVFRAAVDALLAGDALQIYPEGRSHSGPSLEPLRTGAARIALTAESMREGRLGLQIVPIGLTWEGKHRFGGRVLAEVGAPFPVATWVTPEGPEDAASVRGLTDEIAARLREVTLNLATIEDLDLVLAADRIYSRERRLHTYRERDLLSARVPRLRRFAEAMEWLRSRDPAEFKKLASRVRRVDGVSRVLGVQEGAVPRRYPQGAVIRYTITEGIMLLIGLPLALVGSVLWYPAWILPSFVVPRVRPDYESVATYKFATGLLTVPLTLLIVGLVGFRFWRLTGAGIAVAAAAIVALAALGWRERWREGFGRTSPSTCASSRDRASRRDSRRSGPSSPGTSTR